jgi:NADH dehydrogenase [ubiquinone] 1 alpha subcomplex assembly factor 1
LEYLMPYGNYTLFSVVLFLCVSAFEMPITLFTFDTPNEPTWSIVNDGVMGGRSAGFVSVEGGTLRFTGTLVTQGGGFTLTRAARRVDLTGHVGVELRVRGSGRQFQVELDDGTRRYGRNVSRRAPFATSAEWTVVRVPFSALKSTIFGQAVNAPPFDPSRVQSVGLYMADGQDGAFRLEVDYVRGYEDAASGPQSGSPSMYGVVK